MLGIHLNAKLSQPMPVRKEGEENRCEDSSEIITEVSTLECISGLLENGEMILSGSLEGPVRKRTGW